jgi:hypothetical protein
MRQLGYHRRRRRFALSPTPFRAEFSRTARDPVLMIMRARPVPLVVCAAAAAFAAVSLGACRRKEAVAPPVATGTVSLNHTKAPLGSPLEITYKFVVANDAHFDQDYRVMAHVVDSDEELMWTDDHNPPTPTSQWKPGQTIEYTRTIFIPVYPYVGEASIEVGLYSTQNQKRLTLSGDDVGQRAYRVARIQLLPQTENLYTVFKDGWHPTEVADRDAQVEWQWTKKTATLDFKNPKKDAVFYLDVDNPGSVFAERQHVQVSLNGAALQEFDVVPKQAAVLHRIPLTAAQLGTVDTDEIQIAVDKTFVPATMSASASKDPRELGVRVFHAFIDAR